MLTNILIYSPMIMAIIALIIKWKGMKKFIPAGLFSSLCANIICHIGMYFDCWIYPHKIEEVIVNCVVVPVLAMYWVRYAPSGISGLLAWNLLWSSILTVFEYYVERFTDVIKYHDGYDWYFSFGLWVISWFIWYGFHIWFNKKEET